jgi:hypothetical protein
MALLASKTSGIPLVADIKETLDLPHTLSFAIIYRARLNSFNELPKDKKPSRNLWDKPSRLEEFLDHIWDTDKKKEKGNNYFDIDLEEVE